MTQMERTQKWLEQRTEITERLAKDCTKTSEDAYLEKSHVMDAYRNTQENYSRD